MSAVACPVDPRWLFIAWIEPSREFGSRDLEVVQQLWRKHVDKDFAAEPADLRLPLELYLQRVRTGEREERFDAVAGMLARGQRKQARDALGCSGSAGT